MPFARDNKYRCDSKVLTDENAAKITTGTVEVEILSEDKGTVYIAKTAMTHTSGGVWRKDFTSADINGIPAGTSHALERITVGAGDPPDATFVLTVDVEPRRS